MYVGRGPVDILLKKENISNNLQVLKVDLKNIFHFGEK
jgi:hypothetical protein